MRKTEIDKHLDKTDKELQALMSEIPKLSKEELIGRVHTIMHNYHTLGSLFKEL